MADIKENLLVIRPNNNHDFIYESMQDEGCNMRVPYRGNILPLRIMREIWFRCKLPFKTLWFNSKVNVQADTIMVFDPLMRKDYLYWLRENNPNSRIILYYTNCVRPHLIPDEIPDEICEKVSSDFADVEKYHSLRWDEKGGYYKKWIREKKKSEYDVLYIGRDKGRRAQLFELKSQFEAMGLRVKYHIVADRRFQRYKRACYERILRYDEVVEMNTKTRAILNLAQGAQCWITIRVYEALFNEIKLITDNENLMKCDFYKPQNIFILGKDDISKLNEFLDTPYEPVAPEIIEQYYFDNWLKRVLQEK